MCYDCQLQLAYGVAWHGISMVVAASSRELLAGREDGETAKADYELAGAHSD